ncbi:MAG: hypothetical protein IRY99_24905, partial [Isosphaeraceae bacterium]|nr:hypothetical protein [Isosphaeraceae bacterium]
MKDETHARLRPPEAPSSTVIHHYEEDETILARWLRRGIEKGPKFWALAVGVIIVAIGLMYLVSGLSAGRAYTDQAWEELILAKGADDKIKVAETRAASRAAPWALLQAAEARYSEGLDDLPANREAAKSLLNKAYELFDQAAREAPADSPVRRLAELGKARALESQNELDRAIKQYQQVAKTWPETEEGRQAAELAQRLQDPASVAFYRQLYSFSPPQPTLPPTGSMTPPSSSGLFGVPTSPPSVTP